MKTTLILLSILFNFNFINSQTTFQKAYGSIGDDRGFSGQKTSDGGYIVTGSTTSFGSGKGDVYLLKTNSNGTEQWTKTFGGDSIDAGSCVKQTLDKGYIIVGNTRSFGQGIYNFDIYLIKVDSNGVMQWSKSFGGPGYDIGNSVEQTFDGGYVIAGYTSNFGAINEDVYLIKTDAVGNLIWSKIIGGSDNDNGQSIQQTVDGGFIITGQSASFSVGLFDVYLIKTDVNGNVIWTKSFGGSGLDVGNDVQQTLDNGFIITGFTENLGSSGGYDIYLIKTDSIGTLLWSKTYGGSGTDYGFSIQQTLDRGYILLGNTQSFGVSNQGIYLISTDSIGNTLWSKVFDGNGTNTNGGFSINQTSDTGYIIIGETRNQGVGDNDICLIKTNHIGESGCNENSPLTTESTAGSIVTTFTSNVLTSSTIAANPPTLVSSVSSIITTTICTNVRIEELAIKNLFNVSPNPSTGKIYFSNLNGENIIEIFDNNGKLVYHLISNERDEKIDLSVYPSGIYFYKLTNTKQETQKGKIILN